MEIEDTAFYEIVSDEIKLYFINGKDTSLPYKNLYMLYQTLCYQTL